MLSHIYRIVSHFEHSHGYRPNLLYLNRIHYHHLSQVMNNCSLDEMRQLLNMEIILSNDAIHPHVAAVKLYHKQNIG